MPSSLALIISCIFVASLTLAIPTLPLFGSRVGAGRLASIKGAEYAGAHVDYTPPKWWNSATDKLPDPGKAIDWIIRFRDGFDPAQQPPQFQLQNPAEAKEEVKEYYRKSGWEMRILTSQPPSEEFGALMKGMNWGNNKWQYVISDHLYPYDGEGQRRQPSYGYERAWMDKEKGVFWLYEVMAPSFATKDLDYYPELRTGSDVAVTQWIYLDPATVEANANMQHIVIQHIAPLVDTLNFIKRAMGYDTKIDWTVLANDLKPFPADVDPETFDGKIEGQTFYVDPEKPPDLETDFLQTVHGKTLGFMFWQHQPILGKKYIDYWTVFPTRSDPKNNPHPLRISVYLHIKDLPPLQGGMKGGGNILDVIETEETGEGPTS